MNMAIAGIIGLDRGQGVEVAWLNEGESTATVLAPLERFWAGPQEFVTAARSHGAAAGEQVSLSEVRRVPPVLPGARVICIGLNYLKHVEEGSYKAEGVPEFPTLFARWTASLSVPDVPIEVPDNEAGLDWEGEILAWVGSEVRDADPETALNSVLGYSTFNDITARKAQKLTSQWILGKNADNSGPVGTMVPAAEVGDLRDGLRVVTRVNGEVAQDGDTREMVYTVGDTLSLISHTLTLHPGDLLATGTPSGVGYAREPQWLLNDGDVVEVVVDRLGTLRTPVRAHGSAAAAAL
jgi:2-keto-4-pentenoate hydratase/2-oxohepta-3-ene-1,7-dioic acid hydratase in catechol pathway